MFKLKNLNMKGIKYFKCKKYANIFYEIFNNIEKDIKIKKLNEVPNKIIKDESFIPLSGISKEDDSNNKWKLLKNAIDKTLYLDYKCRIQNSKENSDYIISYLSYKYIKYFSHDCFNKLKQLSKSLNIHIISLKTIYLNQCMKYCNNNLLRSRNIRSDLDLNKNALSQDNTNNRNNINNNYFNKYKKKNRLSLYITDKFTTIISKKENLINKKKRASIIENYNAIKDKKNEPIDDNEEELELLYISKKNLPKGHITNKYIGPTDEKSVINKHRKLLIDFKLRENTRHYIEEKKNNKSKKKLNTEKNPNDKLIKSSIKIKNNNLDLPSLKISFSLNSFIGLKGKTITTTSRTKKNLKNYSFIPREILSERSKRKKYRINVSKSTNKLIKNYFSSKDMFYI
jgi:hypothetical protein